MFKVERKPHYQLDLPAISMKNYKIPNQHMAKDVPVNEKQENFERLRKIHSSAQFSFELMRRATFDTWSFLHINRDELAKAGFIFLRTKDLVQCVFCKGVVGFWEIGDHPFQEHMKHFPGCCFVKGTETSNIPIVKDNIKGNELFTFLNEYLQFSLSYQKPYIPKSRFQTDSASITISQGNSAYPDYVTLESRLHTYRHWSNENLPSSEKVARAGFFYSGVSDYVICFSCGGGLFNWNAMDDPLEDHRKHYKYCSFARIGMEESSSSCIENSTCPVPYRRRTLSITEEEWLLDYPWSKRLLEMGLSKTSVSGAMKEFLEIHSYLPETLMNCMEIVVDWEEQRRNRLAKEIQIESSTNNIQVSNAVMSLSPSTEQQRTKLIKEVEELKQAIEVEERKLKCALCKDDDISVLCLPCNHFHYCRTCLKERKKCPSCDTNIRGTIFPIMCK